MQSCSIHAVISSMSEVARLVFVAALAAGKGMEHAVDISNHILGPKQNISAVAEIVSKRVPKR